MNIITMIEFNFKSVTQLVKTFDNKQKCISFLEDNLWNGKPISPFDPTSKVYKCKNGKYRYKNTGKYFNVLTRTIFDNTKVELVDWFVAIWLFTSHKGGLSSMELKREIDVTQKTAWYMLQKIRQALGFENNTTLNNEVELDETYIGDKNKNRHANKKIKQSQGRSCKGKIPVFGMIERGGKVSACVVPSTTDKSLIPIILRSMDFFTTIYTDEWGAYNNLEKHHDYKHYVVKHGEGQYVCGKAHTNNIENFWSQLKRGIIGVYRVISPKHLQLYVDEFVFRRNTCKFEQRERFVHLMINPRNIRITYKQLIHAC